MVADFHTHILPRVDDGSGSMDETLAMLTAQAEQGIRTVVATPHFYANHDNPDAFLRRREKAAARLQEILSQREDLPQVILGAEVYYFPGMSDSDALKHLTISGKKFILLEMPFASWTNQMYREMEAIYFKQGITPIIAHVDRYISPLRTHGIPEKLADLPVLVQANASFFTGASTRRMALRMLQRQQIHLLGSDCHNLTTRKPNLGAALSVITDRLGQEAIDKICDYQREIISLWE